MPYENQYIALCQKHEQVLLGHEKYSDFAKKWETYFGNSHPLLLEIGTGMGNFFGKLVGENPQKNIVGLELRYKRIYNSAEKARKAAGEAKNFVMIQEFAEKLGDIFGDETLSETYIFFPDPWDKRASLKRKRLLQGDFLKELYDKTRVGGKVFFKTDHRGYFEDTLKILEKQGLWTQAVISFDYKNSETFNHLYITEFEGMYRGEQDDFYYLELVK